LPLLVASFVFYGSWDWRFLFLLVGSALIDFAMALSAVGFDAAKTRAMVTVQYNCFPSMEPGVNTQLCHQGNPGDAGEARGSLGAFESRRLRLDRLTNVRVQLTNAQLGVRQCTTIMRVWFEIKPDRDESRAGHQGRGVQLKWSS
jgi:hypothetical protein